MAESVPYWITSDFFEKALKYDGKHSDKKIISFDIKRTGAAGDHYSSEIYRATVTTTENGKTEEISIIVKCKKQQGQISK
ncbi:hypothetical protein L9F63_027397, partial [Diploptera punctata]